MSSDHPPHVTELVAIRAVLFALTPAMLLVGRVADLRHPSALVALIVGGVPPIIGARSSLAVLRAVGSGRAAVTLWRATPAGEALRSLLALTVWTLSLGMLQRAQAMWPIGLLASLGACTMVWDVREVHLDGDRDEVLLGGLSSRRLPLEHATLVVTEVLLAGRPTTRLQLQLRDASPISLGWCESLEEARGLLSGVAARTGVRTAMSR